MTLSTGLAAPAGPAESSDETQPPEAPDRVFVGFSTTAIFLSAIIRKISGFEYSHTWLCHGDRLWGGAWITQADYPSVHSWTFEKAVHGWSKITVFEVAPPFHREMLRAMEASRRDFEKTFDLAGLAFMGFRTLLGRWTHRRIGNWLAQPNELFCSEFVERVLRATHLEPFVGWRPSTGSPRQIYEACQAETVRFRRVSTEEFSAWLRSVHVNLDPRAQPFPEIVSSV